MVSAEQAISAVETAKSHLLKMKGSMWSSAALCAGDAQQFLREGKHAFAHSWALRSLSYSVGIFHADYERISKER